MILTCNNTIKRLLSLLLVMSMMVSTTACGSEPPKPVLSDPNPQITTENIETESIEVENLESETILTEFITEEIYLEEFILVEDKITELLLEEDMIDEVTVCKTIYVPQENIDEFSEHSQTARLFGEGFDIKPVLKKVAVGTGVIVTIAIVKKVGVPQPIASVIAAAAEESLHFAETGAVIGTVFGAFTGAADEIDKAGRISAVAGFALATVGLIITAVSLVGAIPSAGTTGFGIAEGVHLAWAGVKVLLATVGTAYSARQTVKAFTATDASEIDWDNIDWDKLGVSAAQRAINNGADGYMWGAIFGAIDGTVEGYYQKYCTPYTQYQNRLKRVPRNSDKGHWIGDPGESDFILSEPIKLPDGTIIDKVHYQNAIPDFSPYAIAEVKVPHMTSQRQGPGGNYEQADTALAEYWTRIRYNNRLWSTRDVTAFRENYPYKLTWHEMCNMESMQLVPFDVNNTFGHYGGVAEYNAMIGERGAADFD